MANTFHGPQLKEKFYRVLELDHYFFLKYINDLFDDLASNPEFFTDITFLFFVWETLTKLANDLNNDLSKTTAWASQWKKINLSTTTYTKEVGVSHNF